MKSVIVVLFLVSALFAEQVVDFINLTKVMSLQVNEESISFTLQGKTNEPDKKVTVSGSINDGMVSFHLAEFLGLKTLRIDTKVMDTLLEANEN